MKKFNDKESVEMIHELFSNLLGVENEMDEDLEHCEDCGSTIDECDCEVEEDMEYGEGEPEIKKGLSITIVKGNDPFPEEE